MTDLEYLQAYVRTGSNHAFAALVSRHLGWVYGAAFRQTRSTALAEEIAHLVFLDLARHAGKLHAGTQLNSWLCVVTRRVAVDAIRRESRRAQRERIAVDLAAMNADDHEWSRAEPLIDEALASLDERDRRAVLLRFFEQRSLGEIGAALGISDDAAQKRLGRALERLRDFLRRRGVTTTVAALGAGLTASAQISAPAGLATTIATTAPLAATSTAAGGWLSWTTMTLGKKLLVGSTAALVAGGFIVQGTLLAERGDEIARLKTALERRDAQPQYTEETVRAERIAHVSADSPVRANADAGSEAATSNATPGAPPPATEKSLDLLAQLALRVTQLRERFESQPGQRIPELARLTDEDWIAVALERELKSDAEIRRSMSELRRRAKSAVFESIREAFQAEVTANQGEVPETLDGVRARLTDDVARAALERYEIVKRGNILTLDPKEDILLREKPSTVADAELDPTITMAWRRTSMSRAAFEPRRSRTPLAQAAGDARQAYTLANGGQAPKDPSELLPYFRTAADEAAFKEQLKQPRRAQPRSSLQAAVDEAANAYARDHGGKTDAKPEELLPYFRNSTDAERYRRTTESLKKPQG